MPRTPLRFSTVNSKEGLEAAKLFAASFDHVIDDHTIHPIVLIHRGDKQVGYMTMVPGPVCFPNFHTDKSICSSRDFLEIVEQLRAWQCLQTIGHGGQFPNGFFFVGLATGYPEYMKTALKHMGFRNTKHEIWQFA